MGKIWGGCASKCRNVTIITHVLESFHFSKAPNFVLFLHEKFSMQIEASKKNFRKKNISKIGNFLSFFHQTFHRKQAGKFDKNIGKPLQFSSLGNEG